MTLFEAFMAGFQAGMAVTLQAHREETRKRVQRHRMKNKGCNVTESIYTSIDTIKKDKNPCNVTESSEVFDRFWLAYPRRVDKKAARKSFGAATQRADPEWIIAAAGEYAAQMTEWKCEARHIKHPATWLNGDCWTNFPPKVKISDKDWEKIISLERGREEQRERKLREDALRRRGRL